MSGFCGVVSFDGRPVERDLFARMLESFAISAPDGSASLLERDVALGYSHLATGRPVEAMLPATLDGRTFITGDFRLDDRDALAALLGAARDRADHELALLAFARWGEQCPQHLLGDFAFAIWSSDSRELFCARDPFGVKPLYFARRESTFLFASAIAPLRMHPIVSGELDRHAVEDFLMFGWQDDRERTIFRDIRCLPGGKAMRVDARGVRTIESWALPIETPMRGGDVVEGFREVLSQAVRDRTPSRVTVSLSGGLDSSSVTAIAREHATTLDAFTIVYDSIVRDDERPFATSVANRLEIPLHLIDGGAYRLFEKRHDREEPANDPLGAVAFDMHSAAAARSRVMLAGQGGDAVLYASHSYFFNLLRRGRLLRFAADAGGYAITRRRRPPLVLRSSLRRALKIRPLIEPLPPWLDPKLEDRWRRHFGDEPEVHPTRPQAYNLLRGAGWQRLAEYLDPAAIGVPLEYRNPFLDVRVVRFLLRVPPMPWFAEKEILREAMRGRLPEEVRMRRKTPLTDDPTHVLMSRQADELALRIETCETLDLYLDRKRAAETLRSPQRTPFQSYLLAFPVSLALWLPSAARDPLILME